MLRWASRILAILVMALFAFEGYCVLHAAHTLDARMAPFSAPTRGLSAWQLDAIVRVQDPFFRAHRGIEWPSPLTTTTITQSLVKKIFFEEFRPGVQKVEQTLIATFVVDPRVSKDLQLHAFTQTAYFGHRNGRSVVGFEDAASTWFGSSVQALTRDQFLSLLAMLPSPNTLTPGTAQAAVRVERVKRLLASQCVHTRIAEIQLEQCNAK
jgi:membrane carboxypeptidase/penicillin-binding protein PbpC